MTLNTPAWKRLIDEDLDWLSSKPWDLENDHIRQCLRLLREVPPHVIEELNEKYRVATREAGPGDHVVARLFVSSGSDPGAVAEGVS